MAHVTILSREDKDNGTSQIWLSYDQERARLVIMTATLDAPEGHSILTLMAQKAASDIKTARERGRLRLDG
jgi:hypothetical protein